MNAEEFFKSKHGGLEPKDLNCIDGEIVLSNLKEFIKLKETEIWNAAIDAAVGLALPTVFTESGFLHVEKQSILNLKK